MAGAKEADSVLLPRAGTIVRWVGSLSTRLPMQNSTATAPHRSPAGFRADLAGLRGVAVLLVAIYHIWVGRVSGGVDVFLLMSAFFLTGGWVRATESGRPRGILSSWIKRLRGLLPAAALVIATILLLTLLILPGTRWPETLSQAWASLGYTQNVHLANVAVDYYNPDHSKSSPLQHFWSLSVQGQVFLLWPLLLAGAGLVARYTRRFGWGLRRVSLALFGAVFIASFAYSVVFTAQDQGRAYFSTPARLWEFALGSLLALVVDKIPTLPRWLARCIGWLGFAALISCGMVLQVEGQFPGYAALWPTLAAAAIVVAGSGSSGWNRADVSWWLSRRPAVWLGEISYPLYLWHWPLLVFGLFLWGSTALNLWQGAVVLVLAVLLAMATHRFVELPAARWAARPLRALEARVPAAPAAPKPVRGSRPRGWRRVARKARRGVERLPRRAVGGLDRHARALAIVALCFAVALPVALWQASLNQQAKSAATQSPQDNPGAATLEPGYSDEIASSAIALPLPADQKQDWATTGQACAGQWAIDSQVIESCHEGGDLGSKTTVLVVGDSHAQQWTPALDAAAQAQGWHWVALYRPGCRFGSTEEGSADPECAAYTQEAKDYVAGRTGAISAIVTVATKSVAAGEDGASAGESEVVVPGLVDAISPWLKEGLPVVGLRDTPRFSFDMADCAARLTTTEEQCSVPLAEQLAPLNPLLELTSGPARLKGLTAMDMSDVVCPDGTCVPAIGNVNVWIDDSHLTSRFALTTGEIFERRLLAALGWDARG
ncbi:acyltransferase [Galactobacter valiniphilus]|uniref:Acyltransferase n=2 Tax=Galactobacter valiniphilus TaxID=2676122 RepID=A0A399JGV3_9MICC|nr:acyltransferase [Galactobacter valiniphilus]